MARRASVTASRADVVERKPKRGRFGEGVGGTSVAVTAWMVALALTTSLSGLETSLVFVEVECARGPGSFDLVGLAEAGVKESRVRVRSALAQLSVGLEEQRIVVNLAPGDVRKTGASFDLAIAAATLSALGITQTPTLADTALLGELSLEGSLRPVRGVLPQLLHLRERGVRAAVVPAENGAEAAVVSGIETRVATHLSDVLDWLEGKVDLPLASRPPSTTKRTAGLADLSEVRGQYAARRALEIAAAGHHHVLMMGPPGGGKTMLARRVPGILPPFEEDEALETSAIHSIAGLLPKDSGLLAERPFRAPHHTITDAGMVGGGFPPRPGEISLSHHGVLFLDELAEFRRSTLETLRQPLEDGVLILSRARSSSQFPTRPLLIAASNPCPCGYHGDGSGRCGCSPEVVRRYMARLSGPLLDRIDLHLSLPPVAVTELSTKSTGEPSAAVRERVVRARARQTERRESGQVASSNNGSLSPREVEAIATPDAEGQRILTAAASRAQLSARAFGKILRVARTLADLAGEAQVRAPHVAEAMQLRLLDRAARPTPNPRANLPTGARTDESW
jgi:magnesium chelatase family protein